MGTQAEAFDADLRAALAPWTDDGNIAFEMGSRLAWGAPRQAALS